MSKLFPRRGNLVDRFLRERDANAAIEFAFIVPLMLSMFFGTVEFSSGVAAKREDSTLMATSRPRRVSWARYTSPIPPSPIFSTSR